jgi:nitroreductase
MSFSEEVLMDYEGFLSLVKARRSIRNFRTDPIPDEYVEKIIDAARYAPSAGNSQPWEFIVLTDPRVKEEVVEIVKENRKVLERVELSREEVLRYSFKGSSEDDPGFKRAPVFILLCGDSRTKEAFPKLTSLTRGDSHFISNLASAYLYMDLAATSLGLVSQRVSATGSAFAKPFLRNLLNIPVEFEIYHMAAIGYPAMDPYKRFLRDLEQVVHHNRYEIRKFRDQDAIRNYILQLRKRG